MNTANNIGKIFKASRIRSAGEIRITAARRASVLRDIVWPLAFVRDGLVWWNWWPQVGSHQRRKHRGKMNCLSYNMGELLIITSLAHCAIN
jgi:hypothetical protein